MATRFVRPASTTLDSDGNGQASVSPDGGDWLIKLTSVSVAPVAPATAVVNQPQASLYHGGVSEQNFLEGTYSGSKDASDTVHVVAQGEQFTAVWTGGDPGARATLRVTGLQGRTGEFTGS